MAISPKGIQLLEEPGVFEALWKHTREPAWRAAGKDGSHTVIADGSGNGYTLSSPESAHITNGPTGKAGWDDKTAPFNDLLFARRFASSLTADVESAVIDSAVPVAANAEHTLQVCFQWDWDLLTTRGIHATANNTAGSGIGNDYINRITGHTDGTIRTFTENNDTNVTGVSSTGAIRPGLWQFVTFVYRIQSASSFDCRIFVHTLETNGTVTGIGGDPLGFDVEVTTQRCNTGSGLTDGRIDYGAENLGGVDFIGSIALGRFVKEALSDATVDAQAREFLLNGTLADYGTNELYRHEFNEEPDLVDEGDFGLHVWNQNDLYGGDNAQDIAGTGGRVFNSVASPRYVARNYSMGASLQSLFGHSHPVYFADLFTDELVSVPEWTMQWLGVPYTATTLQLVYMSQASGETRATNHVTSTSLNLSTGVLNYFAERGNGVNISIASTTGAADTDPGNLLGVRLYTLRCGEDPGSPGVMRFRLSEDDSIDVLTHTFSGVPQGGESNVGLNMPCGNGAFQQEFAFFTRELTDEEIGDTYASLGGGGDTTPPTVTVVSPTPDGPLAPTPREARETPVVIDVTDVTPGLGETIITMRYAKPTALSPDQPTLVIYEDGGFTALFDSEVSGTTAITNGLRFTILPVGGWDGEIEQLRVHAVDQDGQKTPAAPPGIGVE